MGKDKKDKKSKSEKKEKVESEDKEEQGLGTEYKTRLFVSPIADPLATDKMSKKLLKLTK